MRAGFGVGAGGTYVDFSTGFGVEFCTGVFSFFDTGVAGATALLVAAGVQA